MRQLACKEGDGRRIIEAIRNAAGVSGEAEAAAEKASQPIRSSVRRAAKRAEAGPCVGRATDRLTVDVGDEEVFHGSREEGRRVAAIGMDERRAAPGAEGRPEMGEAPSWSLRSAQGNGFETSKRPR